LISSDSNILSNERASPKTFWPKGKCYICHCGSKWINRTWFNQTPKYRSASENSETVTWGKSELLETADRTGHLVPDPRLDDRWPISFVLMGLDPSQLALN
jgi:hypothetical protein